MITHPQLPKPVVVVVVGFFVLSVFFIGIHSWDYGRETRAHTLILSVRTDFFRTAHVRHERHDEPTERKDDDDEDDDGDDTV